MQRVLLLESYGVDVEERRGGGELSINCVYGSWKVIKGDVGGFKIQNILKTGWVI